MIVEVMGRNAGWLALYAGVAGGGDIIIIPEIPYEVNAVVDRVKERSQRGKRFTIIVISEGAREIGGQVVIRRMVKESAEPVRLGGISFALANQLEQMTGIETRALVMGHLLRGGSPTPADRVLATRLGTKAIDLVLNHEFGCMVGVEGNGIVKVPLAAVSSRQKTIPADNPLVTAARSVGTSFGDRR
jgi:6-phosphofructokinase